MFEQYQILTFLPCGAERQVANWENGKENNHDQNFGKRRFLKSLLPFVCTLKLSRAGLVWTLKRASCVN